MARYTIPNKRFNQSIEYTEPCMNCFASVTYMPEEVFDNPKVTGGKAIICPRCRKIMSVNFCNISLV